MPLRWRRQPWRFGWTGIMCDRRISLLAALPPAPGAREAEALLNAQTIDREIALAAGRAAFAEARAGEHNAFKIELGARTLADAIMIAGGKIQ